MAIRAGYSEEQILGWTVRFERGADWGGWDDRFRRTLEEKLRRCETLLAPAHVVLKRKIRFHVDRETDHSPEPSTYHWSDAAPWLARMGEPVEKADSINVYSAERYLNYLGEYFPDSVLHELAHAYHNHVVPGGRGNREIIDCYERAKRSGRYDMVPNKMGGRREAYAMRSQEEFFASNSVSLLGENDYYPFDVEQLQADYPEVFDLMRRLWKR